ncbi:MULTISPECIES: type 1 glutamine amidotransferase [Pseudonocardia]|uniref:type 1 glutamine amidotransferase n=1 Tax=Pseudonocardia TaxID=1847 RepID=UPI0013021D80|nr:MULTISPECIES: gamma-glutamyl-gamma-aminobutyrate hydrolase family protein [Pseudonocardia]
MARREGGTAVARSALVIGHDHVAGLGLLGPALAAHGYRPEWVTVVPAERYTTPDVDVVFPDPRSRDLVVTLGAPWPRELIRGWAAAEARFLRRAHDAGVPVLAICFGAQLLAETLGGTTRPLGRARIGWHRVRPLAVGLPPGPWFSWNAEQLVPPPGATILADGAVGCEGFRIGRSVGLQFHPEMDPGLLDRWLTLGVPDGLDADRLRSDTAHRHARAAAQVGQLITATGLLPPGPRRSC